MNSLFVFIRLAYHHWYAFDIAYVASDADAVHGTFNSASPFRHGEYHGDVTSAWRGHVVLPLLSLSLSTYIYIFNIN